MNVAIIAAKGRSERLPRKNILPFAGKPLIAYSIEAARNSGLFGCVLVSTDDDEIKRIAAEYGARHVHRDARMTWDDVGPVDVARAVIQDFEVRVDHVCVIYATAPMLLPEDLRQGFRALQGHFFAISVNSDPDKPLQDAAMFVWCRAKQLLDGHPLFSRETALVPIPRHRVCDINTPVDIEKAARMYDQLANEDSAHGIFAS